MSPELTRFVISYSYDYDAFTKHDAVLAAESEIGASTMLVSGFLSHVRSNENIVWLSSDSDD